MLFLNRINKYPKVFVHVPSMFVPNLQLLIFRTFFFIFHWLTDGSSCDKMTKEENKSIKMKVASKNRSYLQSISIWHQLKKMLTMNKLLSLSLCNESRSYSVQHYFDKLKSRHLFFHIDWFRFLLFLFACSTLKV